MSSSFQPIAILREDAGAHEERGERARESYVFAALALCDVLKTTLGPLGMDKLMMTSSRAHDMPANGVLVTNDGATILKLLRLQNPAAKILVNIAQTQDQTIGDGTTSVCILAGELLRQARRLMDLRFHPQTIVSGYRLAAQAARVCLEASALRVSDDPAERRTCLLQVARCVLNSKIVSVDIETFAVLTVDAVLRLGSDPDLNHVAVFKKPGGSIADSYLDEGLILEKRISIGSARRIENPRILLANTPMDTDKIKIFGAQFRTEGSVDAVTGIRDAEKAKMRGKCERIAAHGCTVFVNRQLIYDYPQQCLLGHGIACIEHADFDGMERIALVTGAEIVSTFDMPERVTLGSCKLIEELMLGEDKVVRLSGLPAREACTIVLRGPNEAVLDESARAIHDALCVLAHMVRDPRYVLGAGCTEMHMAHAVDSAADACSGKTATAARAFATALRALPRIIADNGGLDGAELEAQLRAAHTAGKTDHGFDLTTGTIAPVSGLGVFDSFAVKLYMLQSATEGAEVLLRCDDVLVAAPRQRGAGM